MKHSPANGFARGAARTLRDLSRNLGFSLLLPLIAAFPGAARAADAIGPQLRVQVEMARPQLGDLPSWQEEIWQNEVLPASGRFVRDYRTSGNQITQAQIDVDGIKRYLSFNASQILKPEQTKTLLFVRGNSACQDCAKSVGAIRSELKTRLERRGLTVVMPTADELKGDPADALSRRNAQGWVLAEVRAEEDADHPGDQRYVLSIDFRFPGTVASSVQKQMEILPSDSIEVSMGRLAIDAILEIGQKARSGFAGSAAETSGIEVALEGAAQFPVVREMKTKLQATLGQDFRVVEYRIERGGRASLAVHAANPGDRSAEALAEKIRSTSYEGFGVKVGNVSPDRIDVRVAMAPAMPVSKGKGR
jgi:hypothetical protein